MNQPNRIDYVEGDSWLNCPICGSNDLRGHIPEVFDGALVQPVTCETCGSDWNEVYLPAAREDINPSPEAMEKGRIEMTDIKVARIIRKAPREDRLILNEERPTGLYFLGDLEVGRSLIADYDWRATYHSDQGTYYVEISYLDGFGYGTGAAAEWGEGRTEEEAWRYALGAALGSYDDEIV